MLDLSMYTPVGYELARDILDLTIMTPADGCLPGPVHTHPVHLFSGERLTKDMLLSLVDKGVDHVTIRIAPPLPMNRYDMTPSEFTQVINNRFEMMEKWFEIHHS